MSGAVQSMRLSSLEQDGIVVQAFSKADLTEQQWEDHFERHVHPLLSAVPKTQTQEDSGTFRILSGSIAEQTHPTTATQSLETCSILCKSRGFADMERRTNIEHIIQPTGLVTLHRSTPGLAVFDMDSTLIQQEVIDELARAVGLYSEVAAITEAAMRGEAPYIDFEASLRARVALLKGVPVTVWEQLKTSTISLTPGAHELIQALKALGWKTAVLSGGFTPLAEWVKDTLGLDYAYANHLVTDEEQGTLTGELVPGKPIIHAEKKRELLREIASWNNIPTQNAIAVGDGSNDLLMMGAAGLGIAFNAKPKVQQAAPVRLNSPSLLDVMHILGWSQQEVSDILSGKVRRSEKNDSH